MADHANRDGALAGAGDIDQDAAFRAAVAIANIPTLLMVLVQLTGDTRWLEPPYAPERGRGLDDNDDGGLPDDVQAEIRAGPKLLFEHRWRGIRDDSMECKINGHQSWRVVD